MSGLEKKVTASDSIQEKDAKTVKNKLIVLEPELDSPKKTSPQEMPASVLTPRVGTSPTKEDSTSSVNVTDVESPPATTSGGIKSESIAVTTTIMPASIPASSPTSSLRRKPGRTQTRSSRKAKLDASPPGTIPVHRSRAPSKPYPPDQPILARSSSKGYVFIPPNEYVNKRRVSSRSIKRKKFADEVVECSIIKTRQEQARGKTGSEAQMGTGEDCLEGFEEGDVEVMPPPAAKPSPPQQKLAVKSVKPVKPVRPSRPTPPVSPEVVAEKKQRKPAVKTEKPTTASKPTTPTAPDFPAKKKPKLSRQSSSASKRGKKSRSSAPTGKELGRWRPEDDLALISAVQQTNDLEAVYQGVKFSKHFSMKEIEARWYSLLYDQTVSTLAQQAMRTLHPDIKTDVLAKALFSEDEEKILSKIGAASQPTLDTFQQLINKNVTVFHPSRTAKSLHSYWLLMKQYHLLPDQSVQPMPKGDHVLNFSDAEDLLDDNMLQDPRDEILEQELDQFDRRQKRQIQQLENEIPKWTVMVENVTGVSTQEFDGQTLAVLRGRLVRYLMRSKEITLGRSSKDSSIDVDLSLEGPASKISRKQGIIKLKNNGDFYILNEGKRPVYVDGKPVISNQRCKLNNNAVVEIAGLRFIFLVNQDLNSQMRGETPKPVTATT